MTEFEQELNQELPEIKYISPEIPLRKGIYFDDETGNHFYVDVINSIGEQPVYPADIDENGHAWVYFPLEEGAIPNWYNIGLSLEHFPQPSRQLLDNSRGRFLTLGGTVLGATIFTLATYALSRKLAIKEKSGKDKGQSILIPPSTTEVPPYPIDEGSEEKDQVDEERSVENEQGIILDIPYFSQKDERWANEILGNNPDGAGYTIYWWGCRLAVTAMLQKARGIDLNPSTLNTLFINTPGVYSPGDGNYHEGPGDQALDLKKVWTSDAFWNVPVNEQALKDVRKHLKDGQPLIALCNLNDSASQGFKEHYVLVIGWEKDPDTNEFNYIFHDPWVEASRKFTQAKFAEKMIQFRAYEMQISPQE